MKIFTEEGKVHVHLKTSPSVSTPCLSDVHLLGYLAYPTFPCDIPPLSCPQCALTHPTLPGLPGTFQGTNVLDKPGLTVQHLVARILDFCLVWVRFSVFCFEGSLSNNL